jgi:hypothetical protein
VLNENHVIDFCVCVCVQKYIINKYDDVKLLTLLLISQKCRRIALY